MDSELVLLSYCGKIDYETHESLIDQAKNLPELNDIDLIIKKRLIYIIIEGLENIYKHSDNPHDASIKNDLEDNFILISTADSYTISIGNLVHSQKAKQLKQQIEYINTLDQESLKKHYNEIITNGLVSEKNGAGLGIVRIALKSGNKINYSIIEIDSDTHYFKMWVELPRSLKRE